MRGRHGRQSRGLSRGDTGTVPHRPFPRCPANPVWDHSVAESSGPSGGKSDGGVVGEVTRLVGTPIHAHSLVVG